MRPKRSATRCTPWPIRLWARHATPRHTGCRARRRVAPSRKCCVLSAGETTVRVVGQGRGGRNQEFVLALAASLVGLRNDVVAASVGTDGVDGPTDAAGALVDKTSLPRAVRLGLNPEAFLADNNAYEFFATLGDLIHLGPTDTNVGDVQVLLSTGGEATGSDARVS
jgi:glycerate 2-kinase